MKKLSTLFILILFATQLFSQNNWGIKFNGLVKGDYMFDSRQTVTAREGHLLLYPANEALDADGNDINAQPNVNMLAVQTRLKGTITGPDVFGAKASGVIEGAFFGATNGNINTFRLRHAFIKLAWKNSTLLLGQYWHPMFITKAFPGTISFNTGMPFQPFARNPQIRFIQKFDDVAVTLTAASQRDFSSTGPSGGSSSYLRNAIIPNLNFKIDYSSKNLFIGGNVNYLTLKPYLSVTNSGKTYKSDATISSVSLMAYAKVTSGNFGWKVEGVLGQNNYDLIMLGGYAVKSVDSKGLPEFTNINVTSIWTEFYYGKALQYGVFFGYTKNNGGQENVSGSVFGRGTNIDNVFRVSPRVKYKIGKTMFACEFEYTSAAYGKTDATTLKISDTKNISNMRILLASYYFF